MFSNSKLVIMLTYKIHLHKELEGGFTVLVPALPGCITYGEDVDQAIEMAKEAIELYIRPLRQFISNQYFGYKMQQLG